MGERSAPPDKASRSNREPRQGPRSARAGAAGGLFGGLVAGGLGGGAGAIINDVGVPDAAHILRAVAWGAGVLGLAGAVAGAPVGVLAARRGRLAAHLWPATAIFWAGSAASIEAAQGDWLNAVGTFVVGTALLVGLIARADRLRPLLWKARWLALGWLLLCLTGEGYGRLRPPAPQALPDGLSVELRSAPIPGPLGYVARHHFFVVLDAAQRQYQRWEVWQFADAGGRSCGHVHCNLATPDAGVGGGSPRLERRWTGAEARALAAVLDRPEEYPYRGGYVALPGPNCNTYVAWVLRRAGVAADLDPRALGKDYLGPAGAGLSTTGSGVQAESTLLGAKVGLRDGAELHLLTFTFGIDVWPPALKTPLGRAGFDK